MKKVSFEKFKKDGSGCSILVYGKTDVGKTTNILATCEKPVAYIKTERRSLGMTMDALGIDNIDGNVYEYEDCNSLKELLADTKEFAEYKTIVMDSYTYLSTVLLIQEINEQAYQGYMDSSKTQKKAKVKSLVYQSKSGEEGYGALASQMMRIQELLTQYVNSGKTIVCICLVETRPSWALLYDSAPLLGGRMFPKNVTQYFDLIGYVFDRLDKDGNKKYPPYISFAGEMYDNDGELIDPPGTFLSKYSGVRKKLTGVLHIEKLVNMARNKKTKGGE
jgi:hypothetical protein